jgi:pimeloyl-ACP methyl ester carboxylesterase
MGLIRISLPRLGETMEEARVTEWLKAPGDPFERGDVLLEVETDKTVVEVPALQAGRLVAQLVAVGDVVALDQPIAEAEVEGADQGPAPPATAVVANPGTAPEQSPDGRGAAAPEPAAGTGAMTDRAPGIIAASPRARRLAREAGVPLGAVSGTGRGGRVSGEDVLRGRSPVLDRVSVSSGEIALRHLPPPAASLGTLVLLHGLFDDGRGWRDLPERLARAGYTVVVPDLPGHGASTATAATPDALVDRMAEAISEVAPEGPLRLVGHSMGAVVAAHLAQRIARRVERLVLVAPAGLGVRINPDFLDQMAAAETPAALMRAMAMLGAGPLSEAVVRIELDRLRARRPGLQGLMRALAVQGIQQIDLRPVLGELTVPMTAIFGLDDRIIDWRDCAFLPPRAAIHLLPGAGHLPHAAAAELVASLVAATAGPTEGGAGTRAA